jgi:hypothetical protein
MGDVDDRPLRDEDRSEVRDGDHDRRRDVSDFVPCLQLVCNSALILGFRDSFNLVKLPEFSVQALKTFLVTLY